MGGEQGGKRGVSVRVSAVPRGTAKKGFCFTELACSDTTGMIHQPTMSTSSADTETIQASAAAPTIQVSAAVPSVEVAVPPLRHLAWAAVPKTQTNEV